MNSETWTSAIVGCGHRATQHAEAYADVHNVRLLACVDAEAARATEYKERWGLDYAGTSTECMLAEVHPALVHIATPATVRWSVVKDCLANPPKAILLEKPVATRWREAERIFDECRDAGIALYVNHQTRHYRAIRQLCKVIREGALGEIRFVHAASQGSLMLQGTHLFDLVACLLGDDDCYTSVFAQATGTDADLAHDAPHYIAGVARTKSACRLHFECGPEAIGWFDEPYFWYRYGVDLVGDLGAAGWAANRGTWWRSPTDTGSCRKTHAEEDRLAQARLIDQIACGDPHQHPNSATRSRSSIQLALAAQVAAATGKWVDLSDGVDDASIETLRRDAR